MNYRPWFIWSGDSLPLIHVPGAMRPSVGIIGDKAWSPDGHEWVVWTNIQQCLLNNVLRCISTWLCIVLVCQLIHCLGPILLHQAPTTLFFDNVWASNTISSTAGFTIVLSFSIITNNCRSRTTHVSYSFENACPEPSSHCCLVSVKVVFPITHKSKQTNGSSDSSGPFKYYSHLNTYFPRQPWEFFAKCSDGHNVLTLKCT